jgi:hypothetical protein
MAIRSNSKTAEQFYCNGLGLRTPIDRWNAA